MRRAVTEAFLHRKILCTQHPHVSDALASMRHAQRVNPHLDTCVMKLATVVYVGKARMHKKVTMAGIKYIAAGPAKACTYFALAPEENPEFVAAVTKFHERVKVLSKPVKEAADNAINELFDVVLRDPEWMQLAITATAEVQAARERKKTEQQRLMEEMCSEIVEGDLVSEVRGFTDIAETQIGTLRDTLYDADMDEELRKSTMTETLRALSATMSKLRNAASAKDPEGPPAFVLKRSRKM
jgi:hypothetical protein